MPAPIRRVDDLGFPLPSAFDTVIDSAAGPKRTWGQFAYRYRWALLLLLVPLLFGNAIVHAVRQCVADQLLNRARINKELGDYPEALASANRAMFWAPENSERWQEFKVRAEIREKMQELVLCVADLNETIKRLDDPALSDKFAEARREAYTLRGWVLERQGHHKQAIADCTAALNMSSGDRDRAVLLNQRAYIRALAGMQLAEALDDVDQSLNIVRSNPLMIDTRAYVLFKLGRLDEANRQIDEAIDALAPHNREVAREAAEGVPHIWTQNDEERSSQFYQAYREDLAVMYHHRGEIRKKLGQTTAGNEDIRIAEFYGYSPERGVY